MSLADVEAVADAILYEGYLLYPYSTSALKNTQRWTFGILEPDRGDGTFGLQTEFLVSGGPLCKLELALRFLHPQMREVQHAAEGVGVEPWAQPTDRPSMDPAVVGECLIEDGQEASPVRVDVGPFRLGEIEDRCARHDFIAEQWHEREPVRDDGGRVAAVIVRDRKRLEGTLELKAGRAAEDVNKLTVRVANRTAVPADEPGRDALGLRSFASTHLLFALDGGEFVSPRDPPASLRAAVDACRNVGVWPVPVGDKDRRDAMLATPIILDDYPELAPESPGDLFDLTEIDEILTLRILTLTEDERRRMAAGDERVRSILERTERLGSEQLSRLHGALRRRSHLRAPSGVTGSARLKPGDHVRLRPKRRADIFDLALVGRSATIVSIEQDLEGRTYFTVTVDDDPGRDLGAEGKPGHRFFFAPDEVEPLQEARR